MPRSRFNAVREKARASRHNPINRSNGNGSERTVETPLALQTSGKASANDVLPVLKSLPIAGSKDAKAAAPEDVLWALNSLTSFLASKTSRNELLQPKHDIVARIVEQLHSEQPIEVRDAASGCLRNICIEAAGRARKGLESTSCLEACISELRTVASSLGLIDGGGKPVKEVSFSSITSKSAPVDKPVSEMNRKERRQAAKAEAIAAKRSGNEQAKADGQYDANEMSAGQTQADTLTTEDEKTNTKLSHLTNIAAVLWCLAEMSPEVVQFCEGVAPLLCLIASRMVGEGIRASSWLAEDANASDDSNAKKIDVGRKDQRITQQARVDAAIMCLNALVTLSDSNATICAAFGGITRQELIAASKGKGKKVILDSEDATEATRKDGLANLGCLRDAVSMLSAGPSAQKGRTGVSLGLLALAVIRNIQASLPSQLKSTILIKCADGSSTSLASFEMNQGLPYLQHVIVNAARIGVESVCRTVQDSNEGEESAFIDRDRYRHDDVNNLNLALEVLAELVSDRDEPDALNDSDEADLEDDIMHDDSQESSGEEEMVGVEKSSEPVLNKSHFNKTHFTRLLQPSFAEALCHLAFKSSSEVFLSTVGSQASFASALRGVIIRTLSVLNNGTLALSSFAHPPPSQPVVDEEQDAKIARFQDWLSESDKEQVIATVWRWCFDLASGVAASPLISVTDVEAQSEAVREAGSEAKRIVELCLGVMWNLSRCYEGASDAISQRVLIVDRDAFKVDDHCRNASTGTGVVASLIAAYRGSKNSIDTSATARTQSNTTADGVRVACLGVLSTLSRHSHVWPDHLPTIATLLADCLDAINAGQQDISATHLASLNVQDCTSLDGMIIAVNGIIDTFADETKPWDGQYAALKLHARLKRVAPAIRSAARTIDKRKQAGLRLAADEAWENLNGFIQYRNNL